MALLFSIIIISLIFFSTVSSNILLAVSAFPFYFIFFLFIFYCVYSLFIYLVCFLSAALTIALGDVASHSKRLHVGIPWGRIGVGGMSLRRHEPAGIQTLILLIFLYSIFFCLFSHSLFSVLKLYRCTLDLPFTYISAIRCLSGDDLYKL